ncbi:MAG: Ribonuclease [Opitutia bacterium UBA7350]|nr:MAG: Ribonuclease [Opitutae bacterium UBA7350]
MLTPVERGGLHLPDCGLWMDARRPKPFAVVSHAHSDHTARHKSFLATPATIEFIRIRLGDAVARRGIPLVYGEVYQHGSLKIQLFPAGHILGSAMVYVETDKGESLLYTGDFKTRPGLAAEAIKVPQADILVMESTFGRPEFVFPSLEVVHEKIISFCRENLREKQIPILLAYSLGKAQEVLKILERGALPIMAHRTIRSFNPIYGQYEFAMPETRPLDFDNMEGQVVVMPPTVRKQIPRKIPPHKIAMVSGWALQESARFRYRTHTVLPLSDHADYPDLLGFVEQVNPRTTYLMHGSTTALAADLRRRGREAWSLIRADQLELL